MVRMGWRRYYAVRDLLWDVRESGGWLSRLAGFALWFWRRFVNPV